MVHGVSHLIPDGGASTRWGYNDMITRHMHARTPLLYLLLVLLSYIITLHCVASSIPDPSPYSFTSCIKVPEDPVCCYVGDYLV